jgi:hypothetical protein
MGSSYFPSIPITARILLRFGHHHFFLSEITVNRHTHPPRGSCRSLHYCTIADLPVRLSKFTKRRPRRNSKLLPSKYFFKYCLLAIRLEDTSVYNLICSLDVASWKGDHPAMSPQSCRSEVQRLFSLPWGVGYVSVSISGLGWDLICWGVCWFFHWWPHLSKGC